MMCMNSVDSTQQVCDEIGRQILTIGRRMSPAEAIARIDAVNLVEVCIFFKRNKFYGCNVFSFSYTLL
jgi:hypothetical protein